MEVVSSPSPGVSKHGIDNQVLRFFAEGEVTSKFFSMLRFCDFVKSMIHLTRGVLGHEFSVGAISPLNRTKIGFGE